MLRSLRPRDLGGICNFFHRPQHVGFGRFWPHTAHRITLSHTIHRADLSRTAHRPGRTSLPDAAGPPTRHHVVYREDAHLGALGRRPSRVARDELYRVGFHKSLRFHRVRLHKELPDHLRPDPSVALPDASCTAAGLYVIHCKAPPFRTNGSPPAPSVFGLFGVRTPTDNNAVGHTGLLRAGNHLVGCRSRRRIHLLSVGLQEVLRVSCLSDAGTFMMKIYAGRPSVYAFFNAGVHFLLFHTIRTFFNAGVYFRCLTSSVRASAPFFNAGCCVHCRISVVRTFLRGVFCRLRIL
mmetsp:Transcript_30694/g.85988  ORF Transcript_30694/g.85988 Transcript_30694/m.85988 type:complete len:294 (+) Transcript_30694:2250-3131(+)